MEYVVADAGSTRVRSHPAVRVRGGYPRRYVQTFTDRWFGNRGHEMWGICHRTGPAIHVVAAVSAASCGVASLAVGLGEGRVCRWFAD